MTAAFWSSLRSAACTFSVFFTGRALFLKFGNSILSINRESIRVREEKGEWKNAKLNENSPMEKDNEDENEEYDNDGGGNCNASAKVCIILSIIDSH